jgi:light-regulated signal transduction histidine kinase (bacteriophytochrome)
MSNLSELLPAGAGAKSAYFVASGTLGSGVTVSLKADGTVEAASANYTSFIGITDQAIANTAAGAVIVQGGVSEKVTGLTTGSDYYVQSNGTLSTTVSSVPAGRALSTTSILLEG